MTTYAHTPNYIIWRELPQPPGVNKKPLKSPCLPDGSLMKGPKEPHFMSLEEADKLAAKTGFGVGFVLTENDPYFLFDVDGVRNPTTGQIEEGFDGIMERMSPCLFEVSTSGSGFHFIGRCDAGLDKIYKNKWGGNFFEFYQKDRFIALGDRSTWTGDVDADMTDVLVNHILERRDDGTSTVDIPEEGPVAHYTGPADDAELVQMMLNSHGSINAQFGGTHVRDLWECDEEKLLKIPKFCKSGNDLDFSSLDMALLAHLSFWTGKDRARMARLWLDSPMAKARPDQKKYGRPDYVTKSINKAAALSDAVYEKKSGDDPKTAARRDFLSIAMMIEYFKGCVHVGKENEILCPDGYLMNESTFNAVYGGHEFQMTIAMERGGTTKMAWEAFTRNQCHDFPKVVETVWNPDAPFGTIGQNPSGQKNVNVYWEHRRRPDLSRKVEDSEIAPFTDVLELHFPEEQDREILLMNLAYTLQYPGKLTRWAPVIQSTHRSGKNLLIEDILKHAFGPNLGIISIDDVHSDKNDGMYRKVAVLLDEVGEQNRKSLADLGERLKTRIANSTTPYRCMYKGTANERNFASWFILTNHQDSMLGTDMREERYSRMISAIQTPAQKNGIKPQLRRLVIWVEDEENLDTLWAWFLQYKLPDDFPMDAPETTTNEIALSAAMGRIEQEIVDAAESEIQGFRNDWVSSIKLRTHLAENGFRTISNSAMGQALARLKYEHCAAYANGRAPILMNEGSKRPRLYCKSWHNEANHDLSDYVRDQGYEGP